ncbi:MAG: enoyl-CoA hydratase-related protein [Alphaproteobacteria bacterium]|nr:enoyl-CoA hydratase-related protein [Alphaproteobacteria bacterium]
MSGYEHIEIDVSRAGVAVVLLNRAHKRNSFNAEVIGELADCFETLSKNPEARLVLLRGAGPVFSAGADIEWMRAAADYSAHENEQDAYAMAEMLRHLNGLPQVTIALIHGAAMGGGVGLAAACDVAIAMAGTRFSFSEVRMGIIPATISPYVVEAIGSRWARALFVTGENFDAEFAHKIGLVQYVVGDESEMEQTVERLAGLVFDASPAAIADCKDLVQTVAGQELTSALSRITAKRLSARRASEQGREGLAAFLEKRKPVWSS